MRIKLTNIIGVSLISLSVVFSALSNTNAAVNQEQLKDYENTTSASGYEQYKDDYNDNRQTKDEYYAEYEMRKAFCAEWYPNRNRYGNELEQQEYDDYLNCRLDAARWLIACLDKADGNTTSYHWIPDGIYDLILNNPDLRGSTKDFENISIK